MRDILFTVKQQKREIGYIVASLFLAIGVNIFSIIKYDTEWKELYSQWLTTLLVAVSLYFIIAIIRVIYWFIFRNRTTK
jgi:uncharacterized membrane protein YbhN (UPF0104 family)